jgi:histidinol-phosphate aminotransferase
MAKTAFSGGPVPGPGILEIAPYVGGEHSAPGANRLIRLASNEGALGPSPKAIEAYKSVAADIHRYPEGGSTPLREALGQEHGLDPARIVCGTGSDELLQLLIRAYCTAGTELIHSAHGFLVYPIAAQSGGAIPVSVPEVDLTADVDGILARVNSRTRAVALANPNNPTGSYLPAAEVERLHAGLPEHVLLILDAAYAEYVLRDDYRPGFELVERAPNVVVTRTFSKIYALGGLRLGWCYGPAGVVDVLNRIRGPFSVSSAAQAAGRAALLDHEFIQRSQTHNETWRDWFTQELRALGLTVHPSAGNFVLVSFAGRTGEKASAEKARLFLKSQGILVRQMGAYGLPDCLRMTIGRGDEMQEVAQALKQWLETP